ncbi:Uncharacterized protein SCF082_LOCUS16076 [Durusdinium trenchii]|uniref:Uncharacterized protein n=1 Tax=Durusdinium trenchii TaxID=1381693 RepID=A0ABP0K8J9_9DINO
MHGHAVLVFLADAEQSSGSDWSLEVLSRALDKTFAKFQRCVATYLDDERKQILLEVATYLEDHYINYGRGIHYLRQLAGTVALPRSPPPRIEFLLLNPVGIQRGAVVLANAEIHTLHAMQEMDDLFYLACVEKHVESQRQVTHIPMTTVKGVFHRLNTLSFAESAKYGQVGRWPATHQLRAHFGSFLSKGYEWHRECLEVKYDMSTVEPDKGLYDIKAFSVCYVDGHNKAIIMLSIIALLIDLGITAEQLEEDETMCKVVASMKYVKCLANRTAEKVKPSALDLLLLFKETVRIKQEAPGAKKSALRDVLYASIADYNKTVGNHRTVTAEAVELWADRAMTDFDKKVGKNAPTKQKDQLLQGKVLDGILDQWKIGHSVAIVLLPNRASDLRSSPKLALACGSFKLIYDLKQEVLWAVACDGKKRSDSFEMKGPCELFGFGSGDFCEGPDAKDVQSDLSGRWVSFKVNSGDELCILEPDRRLPDHIRKMDLFGKVVTLGAALSELENTGEVNVKLSMHTMERQESGGTFKFQAQKDVCFVLDPVKESKRKKAEWQNN